MTETLLLQRSDISRLLDIDECMDAVERVFRLYAEDLAPAPKVLGLHAHQGGFHIKAGLLELERNYFVAKVNANFPGNPTQHGLPSIQGIIVVCDADNGRLLALMDSIEITILRTGAATGIAAKYLSLPNTAVATICGCGNQGNISLEALMKVRRLEKVFAFDIAKTQAQKMAGRFAGKLFVIPIGVEDLSSALSQSQVIVTCTPSRSPFIHGKDIQPGTFIAAVGADSEEKQELFPDLLASSKIVTDLTKQAVAIGESHHAIGQNLVTVGDIHAELGEVIAGKKPGRESNNEIIIFDSTGMALQDVAAAAIVYEKAMKAQMGIKLNFSE